MYSLLALTIAIMTASLYGCAGKQGGGGTDAGGGNAAGAVGAVRWDGQVGGLSPVGVAEEQVLGPGQYHDRLPFYASEAGDTCKMSCTTQEVMDREIAYAREAGLDYWAFCWYPAGSGLETARDLYLSSTHKNDINWCVILGTNPMAKSDLEWLAEQFSQPNYQKVSGRPLVYCFPANDGNGNALINREQLDELRLLCKSKNQPAPFVAVMQWSPDGALQWADELGAEAVSAYCTPGSNGEAYTDLAATEKSNWDGWKTTGKKVIPWVTTGWNPEPRIKADPAYPYANYKDVDWSQLPSDSQIGEQLKAAIRWNRDNPDAASGDTILMYAWNEFSEGGWLCPTLHGGKERLDVLEGILKGQ